MNFLRYDGEIIVKKLLSRTLLVLSLVTLPTQLLFAAGDTDNLHSFSARSLNGKLIDLSDYEGKVVLISNISLKCGTTPQLRELQAVYDKHREDGLIVLGFPSSDFTGEDLSDSKKLKEHCKKNFGVEFPIFSATKILGDDKSPVFKYLISQTPEGDQGEIGFNFEKFLVDKNGKVRKRFGAFTGAKSRAIHREITTLLAEEIEGERS